MSIRTGILGALAALVAVGGIYLLIEVRSSGASPPDVSAVPAAVERPGPRPGTSSDEGERPPRIEDLNTGRSAATPAKLKPLSPQDIDRRIAAKIQRDTAGAAKEEPDPATNPDFDAAMLQANKLYDRHNYEDARQLALKLLDREPGTVRMLRVVVSSSCILGDAEMAQKYWTLLPDFDRGQMATRCERFGVTFTP